MVMKKIVLFTIMALFILCCTSACTQQQTSATTSEKTADAPVVKEPVANTWVYDSTVNKIDDSTTYFASIQADEIMNFEFPYDGGVITCLAVRRISGTTDVTSFKNGRKIIIK